MSGDSSQAGRHRPQLAGPRLVSGSDCSSSCCGRAGRSWRSGCSITARLAARHRSGGFSRLTPRHFIGTAPRLQTLPGEVQPSGAASGVEFPSASRARVRAGQLRETASPGWPAPAASLAHHDGAPY
jgi:hypothetical protein